MPNRVLISGAGFAGLASAFWMRRLGYQVTVVETGHGVKKGGTPVDIRDETIAIVDRMGLLEAIRAKALPPRATELATVDGGVIGRIEPSPPGVDGPADGYEIHRDDLLAILFAAIEDDVELRFGNSIVELTDVEGGVRASFRDGSTGEYALVLGCDGNHSTVRRLRFGPESGYSRFLRNYFTVAIVGDTFIPADTTRILSLPGRTLMLNSYETTTDIVLAFHADEEIAYDYHDDEEQKTLLRTAFADAGGPFVEMVERAVTADNFYFDKLSQISVPSWSSGRIALVGDAGYCASPAAGMGGSLAIIGATALADAFSTAGGDIDAAFVEYERTLRPTVERIQTQAAENGVSLFFPETEDAIRTRNAVFLGN
ncbi:FAD-binding monooxygenase [Brachybacterium endophyticum]|uniref:FAD-binding monooxygenase n=1 Tax=Brachybacterium endophyticum TaxID=2182385 RepID=A0A2U2RL89_9MICO|nr:FAD-dependent monooxygenase [Brachybacterium endophyticum]PWH06601.1 FAD-binding monooxygenase [Brachybacterium endophyticum]